MCDGLSCWVNYVHSVLDGGYAVSCGFFVSTAHFQQTEHRQCLCTHEQQCYIAHKTIHIHIFNLHWVVIDVDGSHFV